jgi:hypothetical protein
LKENNILLFKFYRNKVNRETKIIKLKFYKSKIDHLKHVDPKKWWSICKKICGMSKPNTGIVNILLEMESPSTNSKIQLANDINSTFLEPLPSYPKLSPSSKIEVTNHRIPKVSIESVERRLRTIKECKAPGPDEIPNWFLKTFSHLLAEPVVKEHVKPAVLKHIRPDQYGCVPPSSTKHALIYLIHHWLEAIPPLRVQR